MTNVLSKKVLKKTRINVLLIGIPVLTLSVLLNQYGIKLIQYALVICGIPIAFLLTASLYKTAMEITRSSTRAVKYSKSARCSVKPYDDRTTRPKLAGAANTVQSAIDEYSIDAYVTKIEEGPAVNHVLVKLERGVTVRAFEKHINDISLAFGHNSININYNTGIPKVVGLYIAKEKPDTVLVSDYCKKNKKLEVTFGIDTTGQEKIVDLSDSKSCHVLVGGCTGSGKTVFLKSLIEQIINNNMDGSVKFLMIDPKVIELSKFANSEFLLKDICKDTGSAVDLLYWLKNEMMRRYTSIDRGFEPDGKIVCVIDEVSQLITEEPKTKELICCLSRLGRAAGIHLILATQNPLSGVISSDVKANMPVRVCLRVGSKDNSRVILDENGGENLMGDGDMILKDYSGLHRLRGLYC